MVIVECNGGLWELSPEGYHEMVRALAHGEVVHLPKLGTKIGEVHLSVGSITREAAKQLYEKEKFDAILVDRH